MKRRRLAAACLLLSLTLGGCQFLNGLPFGRGGRPIFTEHVTPVTQPLMYLGEVVTFEVVSLTPLAGTAQIALRNHASDETRTQEVPASELADATLKLEADALPGYSENALNRYRLTIATKDASGEAREAGGELWVVGDRRILPPPKRRLASGIGYPEAWPMEGNVDALEAFATAIAEDDWAGQQLTMTRRKLSHDEKPTMPRVPDEAVLWEFLVRGDFPTYALSKEVSGTGQDGVMTPTTLKIVLSLSEPIYVISVKAFEEQP